MISNPKYQPHIDGLRALAVVPVILFHAGINLFSGGYIGVDVFFVISGYLITLLIVKDLEKGNFHLMNFYERRARRIFPGLFFMLAFCLLFSLAIFVPTDLVRFGQALIFTSIFSSNFFFWKESGYFDTNSELEPLLHTWSLAVEEQFYILYPLFLIVSWKFWKPGLIYFLTLVFFLSLILSNWSSSQMINANYYLLPTRGWEILMGALGAFFQLSKFRIKSIFANQILSLSGLFMILFSVFSYSSRTPFPSFYALMPTIGTLLVIVCGNQNTFVNKLLSIKGIVFLGLISYSTYLWHQPLLAFIRYMSSTELTEFVKTAVIFLSFLIGYISWKYIEKPFREKNTFSSKFILIFSLFSILFFTLVGLKILKNNGFSERLSSDQQQILQYSQVDRNNMYREGSCFLEPKRGQIYFDKSCIKGDVLIWGDSHAAGLYFGLSQYGSYSQLTTSGCAPIINLLKPESPWCNDMNSKVLDLIKNKNIKHILLHSHWATYTEQQLNKLTNTLKAVQAINSKIKVTILGGTPVWYPSLPIVSLRNKITENLNTNETQIFLPNYHFNNLVGADNTLERVAKSYENVSFISLADQMCRDNNCIAFLRNQSKLEPVAYDYGHLGYSGSEFVAKLIVSFSHKQGN